MRDIFKGAGEAVTRRNAIAAGTLAAAVAAIGLAAPQAARADGFSGVLRGIAAGSGSSDSSDSSDGSASAGADAAASASAEAPTAAECKTLFSQALEENGLVYQVIDESSLCISFSGGSVSPIDIYVTFGNEDQDGLRCVYFDSWSIGNVPESGLAAGYEAANEANCQYRWTAFSVDSDRDVAMSISGLVDRGSCASVCISLLDKAVTITDQAAGLFEAALSGASSSDGGSFTVGV